MGQTTEVLRDPADVTDDLRAEWDALAVAAGQPYSLSAWLLAGAEHWAGADMHVVVLREEGRIVGLAPFSRVQWAGPLRITSLVSLGSHCVAAVPPLCVPDHEDALAAAVVERPLAGSRRLFRDRHQHAGLRLLRRPGPGAQGVVNASAAAPRRGAAPSLADLSPTVDTID